MDDENIRAMGLDDINSNLPALTRTRGQLKGKVTRLKTYVEKFKLEYGVKNLEVRLAHLKEVFTQFEQIQSRIEEDDPSAAQAVARADFEEEYFNLQANLEVLIEQNKKTQAPVERHVSQNLRTTGLNHSLVKLPVLELPNFDGSYENWSSFKDGFVALIDSNPELSNTQKFYYLKSALKGEAAEVIKSLDLTDNNYQVAWNLVTNRFENSKLIVQKHVAALFSLTKLEKESASGLRSILDTCLKHIRALEALKEPTDHWDTLLVYLVTSKFDLCTLREWELTSNPTKSATFKELEAFIQSRCQVLENLLLARQQQKVITSASRPSNTQPFRSQNAKCLVAKSTSTHCPLCRENHLLNHCPKFTNLSCIDRYNEAKRLKLCINCLKTGHFSSECKSRPCHECRKFHHTLLHRDQTFSSDQTNTKNLETKNLHEPVAQSNVASLSTQPCTFVSSSTQVLLPTALIEIITPDGHSVTCRALLDSGSQVNFMLEDLSQRLGIKKNKIHSTISGINGTLTTVKYGLTAKIKSKSSDFTQYVDFLVMPKLAGYTPSTKIHTGNWKMPTGIILADPCFGSPNRIDVLLGGELFWTLMDWQQIKISDTVALRQSKLGWLVTGKTISQVNSQNHTCCVATLKSIDETLNKFWNLEENYKNNEPVWTGEDKLCENLYSSTTSRDKFGRYIVRLPFRQDPTTLGKSRDIATQRFLSLERKLKSNQPLFLLYKQFIDEYIHLGHMELDNDHGNSPECFLPHHAVLRPNSTTTKLRVVFNASSKTTNGLSLNDILMQGPKIQEDLFKILVRFRTFQFAFTADLEKMYRQVLVHDDDTKFQKIFWRESENEPLLAYRLKTVTYGTTPGSFLATRTLKQLAIDEQQIYPLAADVAKRDFYMDDLLSGAYSFEQALELRNQLIKLMRSGGFKLRKWSSNCARILTDLALEDKNKDSHIVAGDSAVNALGLLWNQNSDSLQFVFNPKQPLEIFTKRSILSRVAQLFDPLGLLGPVIIKSKILMQKLWLLKIDWDVEVPDYIAEEWKQHYQFLDELQDFSVKRQIMPLRGTNNLQLHGFCDASKQAYGAVVYLRSSDGLETRVNLVAAKSRVAPIKSQTEPHKHETIPRLELCGAVLLTQLMETIFTSLPLESIEKFYWTDSTIVLGWMASSTTNSDIYIANRIAKIQGTSNISQWRHINGDQNPADIISRGCHVPELKNSTLWWNGPHWLVQGSGCWPESCVRHLPSSELNPQVENVLLVKYQGFDLFEKYSNLKKLVKVFSWIQRFVNNCRAPKNIRILDNTLSVKEINSSLLKLIQIAQESTFPAELHAMRSKKNIAKTSCLSPLNPMLDPNGLIRVGGRLEHSYLPESSKHPIVLPSNHPLTKMIAYEEHIKLLHAGPQALLYSLRQRYWPIRGRNLVRQIVKDCIPCFKAKPSTIEQIMADLPASRVTPNRPFTFTGIDFAGPVPMKEYNRRKSPVHKVYIALFVCLTTRAVHIELVTDLTSQAFIASLRRFISRRGKFQKLFSDNATNFKGAYRELQELLKFLKSNKNWSEIKNWLVMEQIDWEFIPPRSPHFGGIWEAGIKSIKYHLKRVIGSTVLTFEELYTLLTQVEACLNCRPLTPLSQNPTDLSFLSPSHFLVGGLLNIVPDQDLTTTPENRITRWQHVQKMSQHFWNKWSKEYLNELQLRYKWKFTQPDLWPNTLVLVKEDGLPPLAWKRGRVLEVHPGPDGKIRVATIKTMDSNYKRPICKLCPLPLDSS